MLTVDNIWAYSEESPSGIVWNKDVFAGANNTILRGKQGYPAGTKSGRYWKVNFKYEPYVVHRVVWELHFGEIPVGMVIDHKDGDSFNNQIDNLRIVSHEVNSRNSKLSEANTSGVKGVGLHADKYWKSSWYENKRIKCAYFSIAKFGFDGAKQLAIEHRTAKIQHLNNLGYGYSERHSNAQ